MVLSGIIVCASATQVSQAREFMIGLYLVLFGLFALVLEFKRFESIVQWLPAMDTYFGKGFFFIFWGFLLFKSSGENYVGWVILAILFLASGICYMVAQFILPDGPIHLMGDDRLADRKAQDTLRTYENESTPHEDPYLANISHPNA